LLVDSTLAVELHFAGLQFTLSPLHVNVIADSRSTGPSKAATITSSAATAAARFGGRLSSGPILHPALIKQSQQHQQQQRQQPSERQQPPTQEQQAFLRHQIHHHQQQQSVQPVQQPAPRPAQSWTRSKTWQQVGGAATLLGNR
jgi:hypothetical protein